MPSSASWIVATVPVLERKKEDYTANIRTTAYFPIFNILSLWHWLLPSSFRFRGCCILQFLMQSLKFWTSCWRWHINWDSLDSKKEAIVTNTDLGTYTLLMLEKLCERNHICYCYEEDSYTDATLLIISSSRMPQKKVFKHRQTLIIVTLVNREILKSCSQNQQQQLQRTPTQLQQLWEGTSLI